MVGRLLPIKGEDEDSMQNALINRVLRDDKDMSKSSAIAILKDQGLLRESERGRELALTDKGKSAAKEALRHEKEERGEG